MSRPTIRYVAGDSWAVVTFPYDAAAVDAIKTLVPIPCREWVPANKLWRIRPEYIGLVSRALREIFGSCTIERDEEPEPAGAPRESGLATPYRALHLLPDAPPELVASAYRCLAMLHHPDRGGDPDRMRQINHALAQIGQAAS